MVCAFFLKKFPYLLKLAIDFSIGGAYPDKPSEQPFVQIQQSSASQVTQTESIVVLFIRLLVVRQNYPFKLCNNNIISLFFIMFFFYYIFLCLPRDPSRNLQSTLLGNLLFSQSCPLISFLECVVVFQSCCIPCVFPLYIEG